MSCSADHCGDRAREAVCRGSMLSATKCVEILLRPFNRSTLVELDFGNAPSAAVPPQTFAGAPSLRYFDSGALVAIGHCGFRGCLELDTIVLRDALVRIEAGAFAHCIKLKEVTVRKGVRFVGAGCFEECVALTAAWNRQTCATMPIYMYAGCVSLVDVELPSTTMEVSSGCFRECASLRRVSLPTSTIVVGDHAFARSGVTSVVFPARLSAVGHGAYSHCASLMRVAFKRSRGIRVTVGMHAFEECGALEALDFDVSSAGELRVRCYAFVGCKALPAVHLPPMTSAVGVGVFERCSKLSSVEWGAPHPLAVAVDLEKFAFQRMHQLVRVCMPHVVSVPDFAFRGCKCLREVVFRPGLVSIGNMAFSGCFDLAIVALPSGVKHVGYRAFRHCKNLAAVSLPSIESLSRGAFAESGLVEFVVPPTTAMLGDRCFWGCASLARVDFAAGPGKFLVVGESAFELCTSLVCVVLPKRTRGIGGCAFARCLNLEEFVCTAGSCAVVCTTAFVMCHSLRTIIFGGGCEFNPGATVTFNVSRMFEGAASLRTIVVGKRHRAAFESSPETAALCTPSESCRPREFEFFTWRRWTWCTPQEVRGIRFIAQCCVAWQRNGRCSRIPQELVLHILSFCGRGELRDMPQ